MQKDLTYIHVSEKLNQLNAELPPEAQYVITTLENAGYEAWAVGGCVRDALLGLPFSDVDIACNATWEETKTVFEHAEPFKEKPSTVHETGTKHGTVTVVVEHEAFEITTFRQDGEYKDGRHPEKVSFVRTIEEDLARRDFTINALAFHPKRGLCDPFGGFQDLQAGIIRCVGDPEKRFEEDALRILRACRFVSQLGFSLDSDTYTAMLRKKSWVLRVSIERIRHEIDRLLMSDHVHKALMETVEVLTIVLPELLPMKDFDQRTPYHIYTVLEHTAWAVQHIPASRTLRWAMLLHDMGKPAAFFTDKTGRGHFYGHPRISLEIARGILERFGYSKAFREDVLLLVAHHDETVAATPKSVKRMIAKLNNKPELFRLLCEVKRADAKAQAPMCATRLGDINALEAILDDILAHEEAFSIRDLALNGEDLKELGYEPGPLMGAALQAALDAVINEELPNEDSALKEFARNYLAQNTKQ